MYLPQDAAPPFKALEGGASASTPSAAKLRSDAKWSHPGGWRCVKTLEGHTSWVRAIAVSPDGGYVASGSGDKRVGIWRLNSGQCLYMLEGHQAWVRSVAFSPDGKRLASAGNDNTIRLWHVEQGKLLSIFEGHQGWVWTVAFAPDSRRLVSGGWAGKIKVWDCAAEQ